MRIRVLFIVAILFVAPTVHAQFVFGVKPGIGLNGAYFGYKVQNIVPFGSIDYGHFSGISTETGQRFDYNLQSLIHYKNEDESSFSIYNLSIGGKYMFTSANNVKPYLSALFSKPIITGEVKSNGKSNENVQKFIDNLSIWGMSAGFGAEYFFSENFSVGGEFGLRVFLGSFSTEETVTEYVYTPPPNYSYYPVNVQRKYEFDITMSLTYSVVSVNYYF